MKKLEDLLLNVECVDLEISVGGLRAMFGLKSSDFELCNKYISVCTTDINMYIDIPEVIHEDEEGIVWVTQGVTYRVIASSPTGSNDFLNLVCTII